MSEVNKTLTKHNTLTYDMVQKESGRDDAHGCKAEPINLVDPPLVSAHISLQRNT